VIIFGGGRAKADFTFGEPVNLGSTLNSPSSDFTDFISTDGLEMYLCSDRSGGYGGVDIWISRRSTIDEDWGTPENLGPPVNTSYYDYEAYISSDCLELYFVSFQRPGGHGGDDIWVSRRQSKEAVWGTPVNLGPEVNSSTNEWSPSISPNGLELYFVRRSGGYGSDDIWVSRRATTNDPWGEPVNLGPIVNSSASESMTFLSSDGLSLFFSEDTGAPIRPGGFGNLDGWLTRRASVSDPWGTPMNLGPIVNTSSLDCGPRPSPDGSMLYFCSERPGGYGGAWGDIYQSPIIPLIDLNADGIVNSGDMCVMVNHWGENYSLCDIGPTPLGDGIVDVDDLVVLSEHLFEKVDDPTLVAHWPLDEAEGTIAYDSAGVKDAVIVGGATWQPSGGQIDGALELDGVDGCAITNPVLNPADGPFSIIAWVNGGAPGQVIVSQQGAANWLTTDADGKLMTELKGAGRSTGPLFSETVITDGNWHRIGLVWDGSNRTLYVDGVAVAEDTQFGLDGSIVGLYIGVDKNYAAGTFFSGLIDDVRIYNRIVSP